MIETDATVMLKSQKSLMADQEETGSNPQVYVDEKAGTR